MRMLMVGGHGTIGEKVRAFYEKDHQVLTAGRQSGDILMDIKEKNSIRRALDGMDPFDAILCMAGEARWGLFRELSEQDFYIGLQSKLMGQVNLVRIGLDYLRPGGSITLTTGILADHPVPMTSAAALVNGAIHSFVKALPLDIGQEARVNAVATGLVEDAAEKYGHFFKGQAVIPMDRVVAAYRQSVEGRMSGAIIRVYE